MLQNFWIQILLTHYNTIGLQVVLVVNNLLPSAGDIRDVCLIPGLARSPGGGHDNPLQYSCLENPMDRGPWRATVLRIAQSWTRLKWLSTEYIIVLLSLGGVEYIYSCCLRVWSDRSTVSASWLWCYCLCCFWSNAYHRTRGKYLSLE